MSLKNFSQGDKEQIFEDGLKQLFYSQMVDTVVVLRNDAGRRFGGVLISPDQVLTLHGPVKHSSSIPVRFFNGEECTAEVEKSDLGKKLALLKLSKHGFNYAEVTDSALFIYQTVHAIGHAHGTEFDYAIGYVNNIDVRFGQSPPLLAIGKLTLERFEDPDDGSDADGTPIFDSKGYIVGLFISYTPNFIHYFVPSETIREFI